MFDQELVLPNILRRRATEVPDQIYLRTADGKTFTYFQIWEECKRWAQALAAHNVSQEDLVAVLLPTSPEAFFAWMGSSLLRAQQVPINTGYRGAILQHVLENSGARLIVTDAVLAERLADIDLGKTKVEKIVVLSNDPPSLSRTVVGIDAFFADNCHEVDLQIPQGHDVASITYTSGTTGASKGVIVYWAQLYETSRNPLQHGLSSDDCHYSALPLFHVSGQMPIYLMALVGGSVVLRSSFSTKDFLSDIKRFGCTITVVLEAMANFLLSVPESPDDARIPLRYIMTAPIPANIDLFRKRFGVRVATAYNMTEIATPIDGGGFVIDGTLPKNYCGRVKPPFECRVVDENDYEVPHGQLGQLVVRSTSPWTLNGGYLNDPQASAAAWRNGWFHTGDGFIQNAEGEFFFVCRLKDAIRRRGENISAQEVEAEILAYDGVLAAAVIAYPSAYGEDDVKAYVQLQDSVEFDPVKLIEFLTRRMPHFMVPRYLEVIESMPLTPTNKIQKQVLRERGNTACTWDREAAGIRIAR